MARINAILIVEDKPEEHEAAAAAIKRFFGPLESVAEMDIEKDPFRMLTLKSLNGEGANSPLKPNTCTINVWDTHT